MRWLLKAAGLPLALVPSVALPLLLVAAAEDRGSAQAVEEAYRALPELPSAAPADVEDLEAAAVELAVKLRAVPLAEAGDETCPVDKLAVSWTEPGDAYDWGAHLDPVGPAPTAATKAVNGVVICQGEPYSFMGFEAWRTGGDWEIAAVPYVHEEHEEHAAPVPPPAPAPAAPHLPKPPVPAPAVPAPLSLDLPTGAIEGYAAYEPQRLCDPTPKPGTLALRNLLLGNHPGTRNLGISRSCGAGGQSEHKEGRALDWGVLVSRANEKAAAERFIGQLMATDDQGHRHAMARRMGVMYVIWNRQIWSAYRASAGWRPYGGASPHTDHVHVSLSWAGAQGRTSFWSGKVDPSTLLAFQPPAPSGGSGAAPQPASNTRPKRGVTLPVGTLPTEAVEKAVRDGHRRGKDARKRWEDRDEARVADRRRRWEELSAEEQAALIADWEAARARRAAAEQEWRAERERRRAERQEQGGGEHRHGDRDGDGRHGHRDRDERHALREAELAKRRAQEERRQAEEAALAAPAQQPAAAPAPAPQGPRGGRGGGHHGGGHRGDGAAIREAQRQAEAQREAERRQQREAQKQAEAQRHAERQQQRDAQKQAERQRRAEVEKQRSRQRDHNAGQRRRRGGGEGGGQAAAAQGGGGGHRGKGHGGGRGHSGGKGHGGRG